MEFDFDPDHLSTQVNFHKRLYGGKGAGVDETEGIQQRVRQGAGGSNDLVEAPHVIGHYHVGIDWHPNTGEVIEIDTYHVRLKNRADKVCYQQDGEDEVGFNFDGVIVK